MKMKWLFIGLLPMFLFGCVKDDCNFQESTVVATVNEITYIQDYLNSIGATAVQHSSGAFYSITNPGSGTAATTLCNSVVVTYNGYLFGSANTFDAYSDPAGLSLVLGRLIPAWQKILRLVKPGGFVIIYVPPSLGYGDQDQRDQAGNVIVPANSYLRFEVSLLGVR